MRKATPITQRVLSGQPDVEGVASAADSGVDTGARAQPQPAVSVVAGWWDSQQQVAADESEQQEQVVSTTGASRRVLEAQLAGSKAIHTPKRLTTMRRTVIRYPVDGGVSRLVEMPFGRWTYATDPDGNSIGLFEPKG